MLILKLYEGDRLVIRSAGETPALLLGEIKIVAQSEGKKVRVAIDAPSNVLVKRQKATLAAGLNDK